MTILFLSPTALIGGAETVLLDIMAGIKNVQPEWRLVLVVGESNGPIIDRAQEIGAEVKVIQLPVGIARIGDASAGGPAGSEKSRRLVMGRMLSAVPQVLTYTWRLRKFISGLAPEMIHSNGFKMHVLGALAKPSKTPLIWHIHDFVSSRRIVTTILTLLAGRCRMAVANSKSVAADFSRRFGLHTPVRPVLNGVDLNRFQANGDKLDLDRLAGLEPAPSGTVRVGLLGTFARWKGQRLFLEALSLLSSILPPSLKMRAYIIGDALYKTDNSQFSRAELEEYARSLKLDREVGFTGFVFDPAAAMRTLDVVVHASTAPEPFGMVIAEAMATGCAVIVSRAGGAAEISRDGVDSLQFTPGSAQGLASVIERLVRDAGLRQRLGREGRRIAEQKFSRERMTDDLIEIYQTMAGGRRQEAGVGQYRLR
ncbi:MAG: glycosyltransferase family 4 protein [Pyrinomonadaceae bacterium]